MGSEVDVVEGGAGEDKRMETEFVVAAGSVREGVEVDAGAAAEEAEADAETEGVASLDAREGSAKLELAIAARARAIEAATLCSIAKALGSEVLRSALLRSVCI